LEVKFLAAENEEVLTAVSDEGNADVLVCKTEDKNQKVCLDVSSEGQTQASSGRRMLDNNTYNLMEQLTNEKSLWRIKNNYRNDASNDDEIQQVWNFIEKDKQELVKLLTEKLRERL
jgi:hypothetical protein